MMDKQNNSIDKLFREHLADHEMEPPMHLLDGILSDKKDKRGIVWWGLLGGIAMLVGIGFYFYAATGGEQPVASVKVLAGKEAATAKTVTNTVEKPIITNEGTVLEVIPVSTPPAKVKNTIVTERQQRREQVTPSIMVVPVASPIRQTPVAVAINENNKTIPQTAVAVALIQKLKAPSSIDFNPPLETLLQKTDCSKFGKEYAGIYGGINVSIDMAQRRFISKDEVFDSYLEAREESEQQFSAYSVGADLTALFKSGLFVTAGLDYHQISEKLIYQNGFKRITVIEETEIHNPNGTTTIVRDTVVKQIPRILSDKNKYQLVQLPMMLGYEINAQNFSMSFYGGPTLNLLFRQQVKFFSPDDLVVTDYSNDHKVFRERLGIGWRMGLGFGYRISGRHQITFRPYLQINPKSFTRDAFPLQQKYIITGLRLGWKTRLR